MTNIDYSYNHTDSNSYDQLLRYYMVKVFSHMFIALVITGAVSFFILETNAIRHFYSNASFGGLSPIGLLFIFAPLILVFIFSSILHKISSETALILLWVYAGVMGASLSPTLYLYTGESIARVFFITASTFLAMSIYGYTTKKNLATWGSFLLMGLIGILIASLVNMFMKSSALHFAISIITVLVFVGFTAYDTQRLKSIFETTNHYDKDKIAVVGALAIYMDFINLFIALLHLLGNRKRD